MTPLLRSYLPKWKSLDGCGGTYHVSDHGHVKNVKTGKILKNSINKDGYESIVISLGKRGKIIRRTVHSLVAECFIGVRPEGFHVNHIDGIKTNNHHENLEYLSPKANTRHAWENGLCKKRFGELTSKAKLTEENVRFIRANQGIISTAEMAKMFSINRTNIHYVLSRKSWPHI